MVVNLVFAILSFICSFIPLFGIPFAIIFIIVSLFLAIKIFRKKDMEKEQKDVAIISVIIIIISVIICIIVNILSINKILRILRNVSDTDIDYNTYYEQKFNGYKIYTANKEVKIGDRLILNVTEHTNDGDEHYISLELKSLKDDVYYSAYDFILYDEVNDCIYYPKYYSDNMNFMSGILDKEKDELSTLKYKIASENIGALYLIYIDDENGVKIAL